MVGMLSLERRRHASSPMKLSGFALLRSPHPDRLKTTAAGRRRRRRKNFGGGGAGSPHFSIDLSPLR
uniref:Uncharacterized protein n=1 Tax=Oryza punctata TaxID=4537 RepID=A0A0E0KGE6_ORYPU